MARHSNATSAYVVMREHPALYQLCIEDNGKFQKAPVSLKVFPKIEHQILFSEIPDIHKIPGGMTFPPKTEEWGFPISMTDLPLYMELFRLPQTMASVFLLPFQKNRRPEL